MTQPSQPPQEPQPSQLPTTAPPLTETALAAAAAAYMSGAVVPWLAAITPAVLAAGGIIDPLGAVSAAALWAAGIRRFIRDQIRPRLLHPLQQLYGPTRGRVVFDQSPFVRDYQTRIDNLLSHVPDEVFAKIREIIGKAADAGTPVPDTADLIRTTLLDAGAPYWTNRAETIARTELRRVQMGGLFNAYDTHGRDRGIEYIKEWLDSHDTRVRPAHVDTDGQRRPIAQPFMVGIDGGPKFPAMYPLDPLLPPELSINCRCDMLIDEAGERMTDRTDQGMQRRP